MEALLKVRREECVNRAFLVISRSVHSWGNKVAPSKKRVLIVTKLTAFRSLRHRAVDVCVIGSLLLFAALEVDALSDRERVLSELTPMVDESWSQDYPMVQSYIDFVHTFHSSDDWQTELQSIYAPDVQFVDSFTVIQDRIELERYFENLRSSTQPMRLEVLDVLEGQQGIYLVWQIETTFELLGSEKQVASMGGTLFRLDEDGKILMQKDFWDSTEGFFRHVPVLGSMIEMIRSAVAT